MDRSFDNSPSEKAQGDNSPSEKAQGDNSPSEKAQGLVKSKYSEYMCYVPRSSQDMVAVPTWELQADDREDLGSTYIIAKDIGSDVMMQKIKDIIYPIIDQILEGNYKGFCFQIPSNKEEIEYHEDLCIPLIRHGGKTVKRNFYYATSTHTAAMTTWALKIIFENLESGSVCTIRDLFYRRSNLFQKQETSDRMLTDICYMFGCTRRSLNLISEEKGWLCGNMEIHFKDGRTLECKHKTHIPDESQIERCTLDKDVKYILVLEKGTIFNYLDRLKFSDIHKCVMMTSNGFPDISSRRFLKWLEKETNLPVVALADPDPAGLGIMRCYAQGSANLALENFNLAVPSLIWVGVSLSDIEDERIELTDCNSKDLTEEDVEILDSLSNDKYTKLSPKWQAAVDKMRTVRKKVSFEILHEQSYRYAADVLLPKLINRAMVFKAQATPE